MNVDIIKLLNVLVVLFILFPFTLAGPKVVSLGFATGMEKDIFVNAVVKTLFTDIVISFFVH